MSRPAGDVPVARPAPAPSPLVLLGEALQAGWASSYLALALYLPSALLGALAALPVLVGSVSLARLGGWASRVAQGDLATFALEVAGASAGGGQTTALPPEVGLAAAGAGLGVLLALGGVLLQGLAYTFLAGGVLERLGAQAAPPPFWRACRRWFWPMLRFGVLALAVFVLAAVLAGGAVALLPLGGVSGRLAGLLVAGVWLGLVNGTLETARAQMVVGGTPGARRALGRTLGRLGRPGFVGRALLVWLALAAGGGLLWSLAAPALVAVPATALVGAFFSQQVAALANAWLKLVRLSVAVQLTARAG